MIKVIVFRINGFLNKVFSIWVVIYCILHLFCTNFFSSFSHFLNVVFCNFILFFIIIISHWFHVFQLSWSFGSLSLFFSFFLHHFHFLLAPLDINILDWNQNNSNKTWHQKHCLNIEGPSPSNCIKERCAHSIANDDTQRWGNE